MQLEHANSNVYFTTSIGASAIGHKDSPGPDSSTSIPNDFMHGNIAFPMRRSTVERICKLCGVNETPLWRKGPDGPQVNHLP